jgi:hypothetical protein
MSSSCEPGLTAYRGSSNNALVGSFFIFSRSTTSPLHHHPVASSARTKTRALSLFTQFSSFYKYDVASQRQNVAFRASCHAWNSLRHPHWHGGPMSKGGYLGHAALAVASSIVLAACSSDTPTGPPTASQSLMQAAPTIALSRTGFELAIPAWCDGRTIVRGFCWYSSGYLSISNTGGGTLNWTSTKSATWIKKSPRYGTAPSTMKVGRWHRPGCRHLLWQDQGVGHGGDEQPTDGVYNNA